MWTVYFIQHHHCPLLHYPNLKPGKGGSNTSSLQFLKPFTNNGWQLLVVLCEMDKINT